jgi:hypothetical protein
MRRHLIGILAILCLACAVGLWVWPFAGSEPYQSGSLRLGAVLAAMWLAFPDVRRIPTWALLLAPVLLFMLVRFPRQLLLAIPAILVLAFLNRVLRPKK